MFLLQMSIAKTITTKSIASNPELQSLESRVKKQTPPKAGFVFLSNCQLRD